MNSSSGIPASCELHILYPLYSIEHFYTTKKLIIITLPLLSLFLISVYKPNLAIIDAKLFPCSYISQRSINNTLTRYIPTPAHVLVQ